MTSPHLRIESPSVRCVNGRFDAWARRIAVVAGWGVSMALLSAYDLTACWGTPLTFVCLSLLVGSLRNNPSRGAAGRGKPGVIAVEDGAVRVEIGRRTQTIARGDVVAGWTEEGRGRARVIQIGRAHV